jgi:Domain of unknown function (DUF6473)
MAFTKQRWYPDYQSRDYDLVDYERFFVDGCDVPFRGPPLSPFRQTPGSYFTCLGAVQTYGVFVQDTYAHLLSRSLGMNALNLAVGGAGPGFYTQYDRLIEIINRGKFTILQCMSARDTGNSRFEPDGFVGYVTDRQKHESLPSILAWKRAVLEEPEKALKYVEEARANWVAQSLSLLSRIKVPVIFFYYSRRQPDYEIDMAAVNSQIERMKSGEDQGAFVDGLMGDFPHMVDGQCVRTVADQCQAYAECLSSRGMGHELISRFTGKAIAVEHTDAMGSEFSSLPPMTHNYYYPSSEMHQDAHDALLPVVQELQKRTS